MKGTLAPLVFIVLFTTAILFLAVTTLPTSAHSMGLSSSHLRGKQSKITKNMSTSSSKIGAHLRGRSSGEEEDTFKIPPLLYGTAWKKERTQELVERAVKAGFRGL